MLREFWFQYLLFLAGIAATVGGMLVGNNARRACLSVGVIFTALALLSFIWGDPIRGPFFNLIHKNPEQAFSVHVAGTLRFPLKELGKGVDITQKGMRLGPTEPLKIFVRHTWLWGWYFRISMNVDGNEKHILDGNTIGGDIPGSWDLNYDENAVEVVDSQGMPMLQIVTLPAPDYDIYINLVIPGPKQVLIINNTNPKAGRVTQAPPSAIRPDLLPSVLFKYPSFSHKGQRA